MTEADIVLDRQRCGGAGCVCRRGKFTHCAVPSHDDEHPSMEVDMRGDKLVVRCWSGCPQDELFAAVKALLPSDNVNLPKPKRSPARNAAPEATFDYRDEQGALLYQVLRFPGKQFSQRRSDGNGGFVDKLGDCRRVLYRLPELMGADPDRWVLVPEGEKHVDELIRLGFVATTNAGGAQSWKPEYAACLKGRRVALLPDNDVEGDKRVADAAATLRGVAREVRVVKLPGLPAKGDILDWLGAGRTVDELRALVTAEPLSGAQLLDDVIELLERYVVFPSKSQVYAVALWVMHSHAIDQADVSPYLAVTSAEKRSGKTLLLDVLELLVARPWRAVLPSEAVVYRKVAADAPTLLLDETDAIFGPKTAGNHEGLRALLNAGNRAGTTVPRVVGEGKKMKVGDFPIFCPKVIAGIGKVPDTVKDRSIPIRLQRRLRSEPVERFRRREIQEPAGLLAMAMGDIASRLDVADARPDIPAQLNDRAADGWEPLLAIADRLGGRWPARARHAAVALSAGADADEETLGVKLLDDCRGILSGQAGEGIFTATLLEQLKAIEESPWAEFDLTPRRLARLLKAYGVNPRTVRDGADTRKGYHRDELLAACERWLDPAPLSVTKPPQNVTTSQIDESEYEKSNTNGRDCDVVTDKGPFATEKGSSDAAPPGPMVQEVLRVFPGARVLS